MADKKKIYDTADGLANAKEAVLQGGAHASEQVQSKDKPLCAVQSKDEPLCVTASQFQQTVKATTMARTEILKQIRELHKLYFFSQALSHKEFEDAKAVLLKDFKGSPWC